MKKILVPVGTSAHAHETLQYAVDFAKAFDAEVFAMDVFSVAPRAGKLSNISDKLSESGKNRVKELLSLVDTKDVKISIATFEGDLIDGVKEVAKELGIDLIIIAAKSGDIKEELYLGPITGRIIKRTDIPALIVPRGMKYAPYKNILTAFSSGVLKKNKILKPLRTIQQACGCTISLLFVKTPGYTEEDLQINTALMDLSSEVTITENATTYLGVLEHMQTKQPDLLAVFRRKRGFFKSLWEKNTIPKAEFTARVPVLVLSVKKY